LTRAHRRLHFESSVTIVDLAGDDAFGDLAEAATDGCDEPCKLERGRDWRSEASSVLRDLKCVFFVKEISHIRGIC
jgi:hypothetical protein